ncbi:MAG: type II secretion system F family protein [Candidatus Abyssobacteria bacterium SURF_5]|uniref:Type II secretion system F family protein n=1 Tax=Abyssobacteria bacterium (strain SURF_5) TaxID=2093360 RepID=A0A3A4NTE4_ABYX5|nr:MAG: type II secretion system F family protein [Candidatus Abyssubacteria bacterium SURF_5]
MSTFQYTARDKAGNVLNGVLDADNKQDLLQKLRGKGLVPTSVNEGGPAAARTASRKAVAAAGAAVKGKKVKPDEMVLFTRSLATMVNAGLPLLQGIDIMIEQTESQNFKKVLTQVGQDIEAGLTFSDALKKHPRAFPELYSSMVRAGEASGNLDGILVQLAEYLEATEKLKREIKSAMTYPVIALVIVVAIAAGLLIFIVPKFKEIFDSLGGQLPMPTLVLIAISNAMRSYALVFLGLGFALIVGLRYYISTTTGRYQFDSFKLRLPVFGSLFRKVAVSRFARTMSTLTRSGVPVLAALEIVERTIGNDVISRAVRESQSSISAGATIADPLAKSGVFPLMVTRMIDVGEKTGALDELLSKISEFYDQQVEAAIASLTSMIEPMLILFLGVVVGGMVLALFLPIFKLSTLVG